jgi:hypothetical protein
MSEIQTSPGFPVCDPPLAGLRPSCRAGDAPRSRHLTRLGYDVTASPHHVHAWLAPDRTGLRKYVLYSGARIRKGKLANTEFFFSSFTTGDSEYLQLILIKYIGSKIHTINIQFEVKSSPTVHCHIPAFSLFPSMLY